MKAFCRKLYQFDLRKSNSTSFSNQYWLIPVPKNNFFYHKTRNGIYYKQCNDWQRRANVSPRLLLKVGSSRRVPDILIFSWILDPVTCHFLVFKDWLFWTCWIWMVFER